MNKQLLEDIVKHMMSPGKGLLAADESAATCQKRFDSVGVPCTEETRRQYRELLLTTPGAEQFISGVIMYDETFWQSTQSGQLFREYMKNHNVLPGIKVDKGLVDLPGFPGEKVSQGLDGLPEHMATYAGAGAKFAKWRSVITIGDGIPTDECIGANTHVLARYARICQDAGIVPIVEPEILFDGNHTAQQCEDVMVRVFDILFPTMRAYRVHMPGVILKTSMVLPGKDSGTAIDHDDVAERTVRVFYGHVPDDIDGIVFLSGGQSSGDAFADLSHIMDRVAKKGQHPWNITFSYSRALQDPVLKAWAANRAAVSDTQDLFLKQLRLAGASAKGELDESQLANSSSASHSQDL